MRLGRVLAAATIGKWGGILGVSHVLHAYSRPNELQKIDEFC